MKRWMVWLVCGIGLSVMVAEAEAQPVHRLGVGANYWVALDDVDVDDVDEDGISYYATYQYAPGVLALQLDLEQMPDRFGVDSYAPAAYLVLGRGVFVAAGFGWMNVDGEWSDDPFYAFRAGLDVSFIPHVQLELGVSYRFDAETELGDAIDAIDTDTVFLGGAIRFAF
jgi:hypothetical protein